VVNVDDSQVNEALSALADGRATPADWALINAAWGRDPALRERWALWHAAGDGLRSAELPALHRDPEALLAALHAQMPAPVIEHPRRRDWFAPVAVAASFVVLAVGWVALRPPPVSSETFAATPTVMPHAQALAGTSFVQAAGREQGLLVEPSPAGIDWALPASEPAASRPALPAQPR
jgi:negative regulator of sigma E activity